MIKAPTRPDGATDARPGPRWTLLALTTLALACATAQPAPEPPPAPAPIHATRALARAPQAEAEPAPCENCEPIEITAFPFEDHRDTRQSQRSLLDSYDCAPGNNQSGAEVVYTFELTRAGMLRVEVDDEPGDEVDIDLHLLTALEPGACQRRHNRRLEALLWPGRYYIVADTFVDDSGTARPGAFNLKARIDPVPRNLCDFRQFEMPMRWKRCADGIDCVERDGADGEEQRFLRLPTQGPVVKEAHLVTVNDDFGEQEWPAASDEGLQAHFERALARLPEGATLDQPWAPAGEGGCRWGQGATGKPVPVEDEMWYITMNWAERPEPGTRMLVINPDNGRAVVASAGYETGPGSPTAVAGVSEEIHQHLGTTHRDRLTIGFPVHDGLPLGPIECPAPVLRSSLD